MLDKILSFIADRLGVDWVVERVETGSYKYKKYASGDIKIWWSITHNPGVGWGFTDVKLPVTLVDNNYKVYASKSTNGNFCNNFGVFNGYGNVVKTTASFAFAVSGTSDNKYSIGFDLYVEGKWK